ncbi:DUF4249 domain-containing protein [Dyadobacter sp. LHD-138]|uniref:DUF4249 domain-containing protein n=1 Tax=Dyadobacter sp. LHD-138 TaxID=3071413 RepID=UPI0027DF396A|nr:DUF4249 domain-containing protein [Dyadobacter sp. LHD-138]MDQ6478730.1 DUF4249 domain-containing protein [Dyadobacter sp. LHD-138]
MKKQNINTLTRFFSLSFVLLVIIGLSGCEDVIDLKTETGPPQLVVDGWITNQPGTQTVTLTWSSAYFDTNPIKPVLGAKVRVTDNLGKVYTFTDSEGTGKYTWGKLATDTLGRIGGKYTLQVEHEQEVYSAKTEIKRVPKVDSVVYTHETLPIKPDKDKGQQKGFVVEFYARDFVGTGDTYWIKEVINGKTNVDKAEKISIAYDAAFGAGAPSDGLIFIQPLRRSITYDSLYQAGNRVGVELHSITNEAFYFLQQVVEQSGNGGIFATPIANIKSNVTNADPKGRKALGYFGASAVSKMETVIDPKKARPED